MNVSTMAARVPVINGIIYVTAELNRQVEAWEYTYNYVRPHETLDYLTPYEYFRRWKRSRKAKGVSGMS